MSALATGRRTITARRLCVFDPNVDDVVLGRILNEKTNRVVCTQWRRSCVFQAQAPEPQVVGQRERAVGPVGQVAPEAPAQEPEVVDRWRRARTQAAPISAGRVRGAVARGAAPAGRGSVGHTKGVGSPAPFRLRKQRPGVGERDIAPFVVVPSPQAPETQAGFSYLVFFALLFYHTTTGRPPKSAARVSLSVIRGMPTVCRFTFYQSSA